MPPGVGARPAIFEECIDCLLHGATLQDTNENGAYPNYTIILLLGNQCHRSALVRFRRNLDLSVRAGPLFSGLEIMDNEARSCSTPGPLHPR